jgi:VCBS repeat-containing protein
MPVMVNTRSGVVREVFGQAYLRLPGGREVPLKPGDTVRAGDVIVTRQDSIVEIVEALPAAPRALASTPAAEAGRAIAAVESGAPGAAPGAGLAGGEGSGLLPGLRVDRIVELVSPADLLLPRSDGAVDTIEELVTAPEDPLAQGAVALQIDAPGLGNDRTPLVTGRSDAPAGSAVTLVITDAAGRQQTVTTTVGTDGRFAVEVREPLAEGAFSVAGTVTTPGGDSAAASAGGQIDTTPPALTISLDPIAGNDVLDAAEAAGSITLTGRAGGDARPGDTVTVRIGNEVFTTAVQADGRFALPVSGAVLAANPGPVSAGVASRDAAGNLGESTASRPFAVDRAPVAVDDRAALGEDDAPARGDLTPALAGQDRDPEGAAITLRAVAAGDSAPAAGGVGSPIAGDWGTLVVQADGSYVYTPGAVAGTLRDGETVVERFTYRIADPEGNTATATLAVTLVGSNDAAALGGALTGTVGEDGVLAAGGRVTVSDPDRDQNTIVPQTGVAGAYGRFTIGADGQWTYTLDNAAPAVQALAAGAQVSEVFTVRSADGTTQTVRITVDGADDPAIVSAGSGAVTEDSAPATAGRLEARDADNPALAFVAGSQAGSLGTLTLAADGRWSYALGPAAQALGGGQVATETFTVRLNDGSTTTISITVTGSDDAPVVSSASGSVTEDSAPSASGRLSASDADNPALAFVPGTQAGAFGSLALGADGQWTYTLGAAAQALAGGQVATETFTVLLTDGSSTTVTITVTGSDDAPVVSSASGSVTEDGAPSTSGTLTASDADNPNLAFVAGTQAGAWGTLALGADGQWTYTLGPAAQALAGGQVVQEFFTVTLNDGSATTITITATGRDDAPVISSATAALAEGDAPIGGRLTASDADNPDLGFVPGAQNGSVGRFTLAADGSWGYALGAAAEALAAGQVVTETFTVLLTDGSRTTVSVTVTGRDDAPVISSGSGTVTEDSVPGTGGRLTASDADNPALAFVAAGQAGAYGSFTVGTDGTWTYTLGPAAQALAGGQLVSETFTVRLNDGSTTTVTITVNGADDAPVIASASGAVTEDSAPSTGGTLTASDADNPNLAFVPGTQAGAYGTLTLAADGAWAYTLGPAAQALAGGQVTSEFFTVRLSDGSTTTVSITVTGTDDAPVISSATGAVTEDTAPSASGTLTASDADNPALAFVPTSLAGGYGTLVLGADGGWQYDLGPAAQALAAGQVVSEAFTVALTDGSTTTVTITVTGRDDAPVVSTGTGAVTEDTQPVASGRLTATDADDPTLAFVPAVQAGTWGSLTLAADGSWRYTLGAQAQALAADQVVSDVFTVRLTDGSTTTVTLTVTGTGDDPAISDGRGAVTEDLRPSVSGTLTAEDADNPALAFVPATLIQPLGTLVVAASGAWTYTLGPAAQALAGGQVVTETFTVALNDGSTTPVVITITGTDDAPVVSSGSGAVTEDDAPTTGGRLSATDVDNPALAFVPGSQDGAYGRLTLAADGSWTYTLGPAAQALAAGQQADEFFTVTLNDGSTTQITIRVTGTDDLPSVSSGTGSVTEDTAPGTGGTLVASDPDNPGLAFVPSISAGAWGTLTLAADGQWRYELGAAAQRLAAGDVQTEVFNVRLSDGTGTTVTITVNGTDDAPVVSAGSGAVTEDSAPGTSGRLTASDADNPALAFLADNQAGAWGSLTLDTDGRWTYTLGPAAQALAGGQTATETFTVRLNDGSTTTVTITVTGSDDAPVVSSGSGAVTEDSAPRTGGTLTASDADNPALAFVAGSQAGAYGSLALAANGQWQYELGPAAQALAAGEVQTEVFTVRLTDGSATTVTITVTGTDDAPVVSSATGTVTEDSAPATSGRLTATDVDNPALAFTASDQAGRYGRFTLDADGSWSYTLGPAAQALAAGQQVTETFTVGLNDGSTTTVTITVVGTDDAPVIASGSGAVTEDTQPTTGGRIAASDIDNPALAFVAGSQDGNYGRLALAADGTWSYTLGPAAQALAAGQQVTETFTVLLTDGSTTTVTVTVNGTDDAPVISAGSGAVTEDTAPTTSGRLTASDADNPALAFVAGNQAGSVGQFALAADGSWSYALGPSAQALAAGQQVSETFTVTLTDGSTTTVTITVTGTDDAPVVATGAGSVVEDDAPSTGGTLAASDVDNPALAFVPATRSGAWGTLTLTAAGVWTYVLGPAAQALAAGQVETETFTVALNDGSSTTITVTVAGKDDAPVVSAGTGTVVEDTLPSTSGVLTAIDADNPALAFVPGTQAGGYGQLALGADGRWSYTLGAAAQPLAAGEQVQDAFTVRLNDGSSTTVTIGISGTNDAPDAVDDSAGVAEAGTATIAVRGNDSDIDRGDVITVQSFTQPQWGRVAPGAGGANGGFVYTADADFYNSTPAFGSVVDSSLGLPDNTFFVHPEQVARAGDYLVVPPRSLGADSITVLGRLPGGDAVLRVNNAADAERVLAVVGNGAAPDFVITLPANSAGILNIGNVAAGAVYSVAGFGSTATVNDTALALATPGESFTYTVGDGRGGSDTATVNLTVTPTNDAPTARPDVRSTGEDSAPLAGNVLRPTSATGGDRNDTDADGDPLSVTGVAAGAGGPASGGVGGAIAGSWGSLVLAADGSYTYTPLAAAQALAAGQVVQDVFTYTISDGQGGSATATLTVNVSGSDDAPTLDLDADDSSGATGSGYRGSFEAGFGPVPVVDADVRVADADTARLAGATVTLTNPQPGDVLTVGALPAGINAVVSGNTVTFSGSASAADYAAALAAVRFDNASATPDLTPRSFAVSVSDGSATSNVASATLAVRADVNDAPVNSVPAAQGVLEDQASAITGLRVADPDEGGALAPFKLANVTLSVSNGTLQVTPAAGASIVAGASGSSTLTLAGTQAAINATLATLAYLGAANYAGADTLVMTSRDGAGLADTDTVAITVAPVNDAPSGTDRTITVLEDGSHVFARSDFGFGDAPGDSNNFAAVTVRAPSAGTLLLNGVAVTGPVSVSVAQLDAGALRFVPAADASGAGYANVEFSVRDDGGTANGGADTDPTPNRITIDVTPVNDAPAVTAASARVSEEGLAGGVPDDTGDTDTTNGAVASGRIAFSDVDSTGLTVSLTAPTGALTSGGVAVTWAGSGTQLLSATAGTRTVATLAIDNGGNYVFTLRAPVDHAGAGVEDVRSLGFGVVVSDGQIARSATLTIGIEDDAPVSNPAVVPAALSMIDTNLMIVLDRSGSMRTADGVGGQTRLASAVTAINRLLDQYDTFGGVAVRLVTFSDTGNAVGSRWFTVAEAKAQLATVTANGGTNYDAAVAAASTAWGTTAGRIDGAQNTLYFFSDGQPTPSGAGLNAAEERNWITFLEANQIKAFAIGLGSGAAQGPLNPVAWDAQIGENINGLVVTDFAQLDAALAATVPTVVTNPLLAGGTFDLPTSGIGADGGRVLSVKFGNTTYTYDPANGGSVAVSGGPSAGVFDTAENILTVSTANGGRFAIDLDNGRYTYSGPPSIAGPVVERFDYVVTDRDGDTTSSTVTVNVDRVRPQVGTANGETLAGTPAQDFILARSGDDAVNGSDNRDRLAGNDGNDTLNGEGGDDALYGGAGNDTLDGGTGNDALDGGPGDDRLVGGAGSDVFAWTLFDRGTGGTPARDTVAGFDAAPRSAGGDVLDLRDLLVGESTGTLDRYLDFAPAGAGGTELRISSTGGFTGGSYVATAEDQRIVFEGLDLRAALGLAGTASDATIIQTLLDRAKLVVDAGG